MEKKKKSWLGGALGLACVMFGSQFGPAVASGTAVSGYGMQAGWLAVLLPLISVVGLIWIGYWGIEVGRLTGQTSLVGLIRELFYPYDKVATVVWDIGTMILFPIVLGSAVSGCATVVQSLFKTTYLVGIIATVILFGVIGIWGKKLLVKLSTIETVICIVIAAIFVIVTFAPGMDAFKGFVASNDLGPNTSQGISLSIMGLFIACQNISVGVASAGDNLQSKKATKVAIVTYALLYGGLQILFSICFFRLYPEIVESNMPTLDIANASGNAFIVLAYPIMLLMAFLSTGPVFLFSLSGRWASAGFWNKLKDTNVLKKNETIRMTLMVIIVLTVSTAIAFAGFRFLMVYVIPKQWLFYLIMLAVPMGVFGPVRVSRMRKELKETGKVMSAAEKRGIKK